MERNEIMLNLFDIEYVLIEFVEGWLIIWFNWLEVCNVLFGELIIDLCFVLEVVCEDWIVWGIMLCGKGGVFCVGGDLKGFKLNF